MSGSQQLPASIVSASLQNKQTHSFVADETGTGTLLAPHLLRLDPGGWTLMGSRCVACGELYFPRARGCTRCSGTELVDAALGDSGRLWSWTIQGFEPKAPYDGSSGNAGFQPYGVGYVELEGGLKVEARLTVADPSRLRIGMPMRLTLEAYRHQPGGEPLHTFAFEPVPETTTP
jgi:uncharacterized protein